jgi:hypothetical protein
MSQHHSAEEYAAQLEGTLHIKEQEKVTAIIPSIAHAQENAKVKLIAVPCADHCRMRIAMQGDPGFGRLRCIGSGD